MTPVERLRDLHAEYTKAAGPFVMSRTQVAVEEMRLFALRNEFEATAMVIIPALLACAEALDKIVGSIDAAYIEGWQDALANGDIDRLRDLWQRRVIWHEPEARAALSALAQAQEKAP